MKKLKIFLIVIALLILVLIIAAIIFVMTFDINRYKTQIISQASAALGRGVDFEKAKLVISLGQGASLKIINLRIAEDTAFGKNDFLLVKKASFAINALGFIFDKKVDVSGILIDSPRITLIREKDGSLNVNSLAKVGKKDKITGKTTVASSPAALPALFISSLKMTGGTLTYIDRMFRPALSLQINDMSLEVSKISLTEPFGFVAEAAVLSNQKNVRLEAIVGLDLKKNAVVISSLKGTVELSRITLEKIPVYFPMAKGVSLPTSLKGQVVFSLPEMTLGAEGPLGLSVDAALNNASLQFKEIASPVQNLALNLKLREKNMTLEKVAASLGRGKLQGLGAIEDYLSAQKYSLQARAENLLLEEIIVQDKSAVKIEGIVSGQLSLNGQGFGPEAIKTKLFGEAQVSLVKPRLKNINVLRTVLDKIAVIPGLPEKIEANLPERFKQKLTQKDTVLADINLPATITNGRLIMKEIVLKADEFMFEGWGEAGFDGVFSLEGAFLIPQDLSGAMVAAVSQLEYLLSTGNQIYIPLRVSGNAARFEFNVDATYIASKLLMEQGGKQLLKVLDKAFGTKEEPSQGQQQDTSENPGSQEKEPTPEEAVKGLLQEIFR
jgi:hypothetical protein